MDSSASRTVPRGKLGREITLVLLFKALALCLIWMLFFRAPPLRHPGAQTTAEHLLGSGGSSIQILRGGSHD